MSSANREPYRYPGEELDLFALATRWKSYYASFLKPHLHGRILEVGAGLGANTLLLSNAGCDWLAIEPDPKLCERLNLSIAKAPKDRKLKSLTASLDKLPSNMLFDHILYLDVLEHIEDDRSEIEKAASRLAPGGKLIILSPAHSVLYSPFDKAIGHYRRYNKKTLTASIPSALECVKLIYIDSLGALLSSANRFLLAQSYPTRPQILFWDKFIIPLSRIIDPLLGHRVGKTILGIWKKPK